MLLPTLFLTTLFFSLFSFHSFGQSHDFDWTKVNGPTGSSVILSASVNPQGEMFTCGFYRTPTDLDPGAEELVMTNWGDADAFIQKLDANGNLEWVKVFRSSQEQKALKVIADKYGAVYTLGSFKSDVDFDPGSGDHYYVADEQDLFISKHDNEGNLIWLSVLGKGGEVHPVDITLVEDRFLYVTGNFSDRLEFPFYPQEALQSKGSFDIFVAKLDIHGYLQWASSFGSNQTDQTNAVAVDYDGDVYLAGYYSGQIDLDPGPDTVYHEPLNNSDIFLLKLNPQGGYEWSKVFLGNQFEIIENVHVDFHDQIILGGSFLGTMDADPGPDTFNISSQSAGSRNNFILKLNEEGDFVNAKAFDGPGYGFFRSMESDYDRSIFLSGTFYDQMDADPSSNEQMLSSNGEYDAFIIKLDSNFNFRWSKSFGGERDDGIFDLAFQREEYHFYVVGEYHKTVDFDPGVGVHEHSTGFYEQGFISKFDYSLAIQEEQNAENLTTIFPNPSHGLIQVVCPFEGPSKLTVFNTKGEIILQQEQTSSRFELQVPNTSGVYILRLENKNDVVIRKVIVE